MVGGGAKRVSNLSLNLFFFSFVEAASHLHPRLNAPLCSTHGKTKITHTQTRTISSWTQAENIHLNTQAPSWFSLVQCITQAQTFYSFRWRCQRKILIHLIKKKEIAAWPLKHRSQASQHFKYTADPYLSRCVGGPRGRFFSPLKIFVCDVLFAVMSGAWIDACTPARLPAWGSLPF